MRNNRESNSSKKILIIDDDIAINNLVENILEENNYITKSVESAEKGLEEIDTFLPDIILCDVKLPNMNGFEFLDVVKKNKLKIDIIMMTAFGEIKDAVEAIQKGALDYITKPFTTEDLLNALRKAFSTVDNFSEEREKKYLLSTRDKNIVGRSSAINNIARYIDIIAKTSSNVVICGSSGTGKKMFAESIYKKSNRQNNRFITLDCENISGKKFDIELFGLEKKSEDGSIISKIGILEQANLGTLYLKKVSLLSKSSQKKIYQVLETNKFKKNGGKDEISIDIRFISSSNEDLAKCVSNSLFRKDLYNKLNEFEIVLPDLKDRITDFDLLVEFFIKLANKKFNKKVESISADVRNNMVKYSWPGNITELKNVVFKAVLLSKNSIIKADLIELIDNLDDKKIIDLGSANILAAKSIINKELIKEALARTGNNKSQAAKLLGFSRKTLYTKMSELGIKD